MPDALLLDALETLKRSLEIIQKRAKAINEPDDFVSSEAGLTILDAIAMRLQSVGEKVKKIEQKNPGFFHPVQL